MAITSALTSKTSFAEDGIIRILDISPDQALCIALTVLTECARCPRTLAANLPEADEYGCRRPAGGSRNQVEWGLNVVTSTMHVNRIFTVIDSPNSTAI